MYLPFPLAAIKTIESNRECEGMSHSVALWDVCCIMGRGHHVYRHDLGLPFCPQ